MLQSLDTLIAFVLILLVVSLLITIVVQMIAAFLNLRGLNLAKGLAQTFQSVAPVESACAKELAGEVLRGGMLSDSSFKHWPHWWRLATAARPDEVFDAIHRIALGKGDEGATIQKAAQDFLVALGYERQTIEKAAGVISATSAGADDLVKEIGAITDPVLQAKIQSRLDDLKRQLQSYSSAEAARVAAGAAAIDKAYEKFQYWYELTQERVQQWFATHTRICTIVCAFVFAFWLQLDTVEIFHLVSADRTLRDQLVAQSGVIGSQAEKVFAASASVLGRGYAAWLGKLPADAQTALASIQVQPNDTREQLLSRVDAVMPAGSAKAQQLQSLNDTLDQTATETLKARAGDYAAVKADFDHSSGFDLFPSGPSGRWGHGWWRGWADHWVGLLFSVGLLSLGAPFWYNILKGLTSLRSTVAQNIADEKDQDQSSSGVGSFVAQAAPATGAPPTVK
jgi:hypothetical protein